MIRCLLFVLGFAVSLNTQLAARTISLWDSLYRPLAVNFSDKHGYYLKFQLTDQYDCRENFIQYQIVSNTIQKVLLQDMAYASLCYDTVDSFSVSLPVRDGKNIVVYKYWNYWGEAGNMPAGIMKTVLVFNGEEFTAQDTQIYYIPGQKDGFNASGSVFQRWTDETDADMQKRLAKQERLIKEIEAQFSATYVHGAERENLIQEAEAALSPLIAEYSSPWCSRSEQKIRGMIFGLTSPCEFER